MREQPVLAPRYSDARSSSPIRPQRRTASH